MTRKYFVSRWNDEKWWATAEKAGKPPCDGAVLERVQAAGRGGGGYFYSVEVDDVAEFSRKLGWAVVVYPPGAKGNYFPGAWWLCLLPQGRQSQC